MGIPGLHRHRTLVAALCALVAACLFATLPSVAATNVGDVSMSVPTATYLDASSCDSGASSNGVLSLGVVLPGAGARSTDCSVVFGASNEGTSLRLQQADGIGDAMTGASPGTLQGGYGTGGVTRAVLAGNDNASAAVMQRDGKIVVGASGVNFVTMARFMPDGSLDAAFDGVSGTGNGIVQFPAPAPNASDVRSITQDAAGRLVVLLDAASFFPHDGMYVARMLPDGRMDASFGGGDGIILIDPTGGSDQLWAGAVGPDGSIVLAGHTGATTQSCIAADLALVVKLHADGRYDTSFSGDGVVTFDQGASIDCAMSVAMDDAGRVVVSGIRDTEAIVYRYTAAGALDTAGFNAPSGFRALDPGPSSEGGRSLVVSATGKLLVAMNGGNVDWYVGRINDDGSMDSTFGTSGIATIDFGTANNDGGPWDVRELADGRVVVAGTRTGGGLPAWTTTVRLTASGGWDNTFSGDGRDSLDLSPGTTAEGANKVLVGPNGRIAVVGTSNPTAADSELTIAMYADGVSVPDYVDGSNDWETMPATSMFGVCLKSTTGTTGWTTNASCPETDGSYWRGVPTTSTTVASRATTGNATATLVFGLRSGGGQAPASYQAPMQFDVLAPNI